VGEPLNSDKGAVRCLVTSGVLADQSS